MKRWLPLLIPFVLIILISMKGSEGLAFFDWTRKALKATGRDPVTGLLSAQVWGSKPSSASGQDGGFSSYDPDRGKERTILPKGTISALEAVRQYQAPSSGYQIPSTPEFKAPTYNRAEMLQMARTKAGLVIDPQIEALQRALENARQQLAAHRERFGEGYRVAQEGLRQQGQQYQREGSELMSRRGLYDSGMAADLANRIQREQMARGERLSGEHARSLSDLADYESLYGRQTDEQIAGLEARRGEWEKSIMDEMEQAAFQRQMAEQEMAMRLWQAQLQAQQAAARQAAQPRGPDYQQMLLDEAYRQLLQGATPTSLAPQYRYALGWNPWAAQMQQYSNPYDWTAPQ